MKIKIGISPCPNDTFIFEAIYTKQIDIAPFEFEFYFEDVQTLNSMSNAGVLDVIKLSYAQYFNVIDEYVMLKSGGALGKGVGPLLIAKDHFEDRYIRTKKVAIPGKNTTANFLLDFAYPIAINKINYAFSNIEKAILDNEVDAGVIIHENRFTYADKGLVLIKDLGKHWEEKTKLPLPLGGIAIKRSLDNEAKKQINQLIKQSILHARKSYPSLGGFIKYHAQEMKEEVIRQHIDLYVNEYSLDIGTTGMMAVIQMQHIIDIPSLQPQFIEL